jgi:fermentation-respiration switch protein FrsA (DUF1100 family)
VKNSEAFVRRDIEFKTEDGTVLRGYLHAEPNVAAPCIVMAHGFGGIKEHIDHFAAAFAASGFTVIVYDHRGFGTSGGKLRHEVDPYVQMADWRDVITQATELPEVDAAAGVGLWGSSFAGGLAMVIGANDARVRCVVAQIPQVSGHLNSRQMFSVEQRAELERRLAADRRGRIAGEAPEMIPVFSSDPNTLCALPPIVEQDFIDFALRDSPSWSNEVTLRSVAHLLEFEPAGWIPHVAPKPLLMIVGRADTCTFPEVQLAAFESARHPKQVLVHEGGHFDTYTDHFEQSSEAAISWFLEHLRDGEEFPSMAAVPTAVALDRH